MIVAYNNIDKVETLNEREKNLLLSLLKDVDEFNELVGHPLTEKSFVWNSNFYKICITWQDWHDEYSPENLEAQDYYGVFRICLMPDEKDPSILVNFSTEMTIDELDTNLCTLVGYFADSREYEAKVRKERDEAYVRAYQETRQRQKEALEKYKDYMPAVGDICMKLVSRTEFMRISCNVYLSIISRIEDGKIFTRNINIDKMSVLKESNPQCWYLLNENPKNTYSVADHNDGFASVAPECKIKRCGQFLFSRWHAIEIIDEFFDNYKGKKVPVRYIWKSCQPEKVPGTTIIKYLEKLKALLIDDEKISSLKYEEQTPPELII
jgi:hypothetical protein